uniref:cation-dependent mannose-6-phosphate receptor-like n=2 Tax=Myxine glutinosa TaxID=7769 RepID=UPI00358E35BB
MAFPGLSRLQLQSLCLSSLLVFCAGDSKCLVDMKSTQQSKILVRLEPLFGRRFEVKLKPYNYMLAVCAEVDGDSASAVQHEAKDKEDKDNVGKVLGRLNDTHLVEGLNWILLTYKSGDPYNSHCGTENRKALLMISCDPYTLASGFTLVHEEREKNGDCFYLFELSSSVACNDVGKTGLSGGAIFLIVLLCLVAAYLLGGFVYQRFVVGAKGLEQIPNFLFWQNLGNILADGCDFVCRTKPRVEAAAYRGVGQDQLGDDEDEEERDDHLLPM